MRIARSPFLNATVGLLLGCCISDVRSCPELEVISIEAPVPGPDSKPPVTMEQALETLWSGDREAALDVALEAEDLFDALDDSTDAESRQRDHVLSSLQALFDAEEDEWLLDRLAFGLSEVSSEQLSPLFRELLAHDSPNVRFRAVQHFAEVEDRGSIPLLLELWRSEERAWIRTNLLEALDYQEATGFAEDCLDLTDDEDPALAEAAIGILEDYAPAGSAERLVARAASGPIELRTAALGALARIGERGDGLDAILAATDDSDSRIVVAAIGALRSFDDERALARLIELARLARTAALRERALRALLGKTESAVVGLLYALAAEEATSGNLVLRYLAEDGLHRAGLGDKPQLTVEVPNERVPDEPSWIVAPPPGQETVRCWRGPDWTGAPEEHPRLDAGVAVDPYDRFEEHGRTWFEMDTLDCLLPMDALAAPGEAPDSEVEGTALRTELDVPVEELDGPLAVALVAAGLLRAFDETERVSGAILEVDPTEPVQVESFLAAFGEGTGLLQDAAVELLLALSEELAPDSEVLRRLCEVLPRQTTPPGACARH